LRAFYNDGGVHHTSLNDFGCQICKLGRQENLIQKLSEKLSEHKRILECQKKAFKFDKGRLNRDSSLLIVVMDFSKIDATDNFQVQDLIIHSYWRSSDGGNRSKAIHYFPVNHKVANDINFLEAGFASYIQDIKEYHNIFDQIKQISIWSDGGRKHFKQRHALKFMRKVQNTLQIPIIWNFSGWKCLRCRCKPY